GCRHGGGNAEEPDAARGVDRRTRGPGPASAGALAGGGRISAGTCPEAFKQLIDRRAIVLVNQMIDFRGENVVTQSRLQVPSFVPVFSPLALRLIRMGVPLGPNALLTVRGRNSGLMRTNPVAVLARGGRRWVIGTFGEVNWVRNLRAAGEAVLTTGRRRESMHAVELTQAEAADFFANVVLPYVGNSAIKRWLLGLLGASDILRDPAGAATSRPVFELL